MFRNREEAGETLAGAVAARAPADPVVLALPRGGVPLGVIVARRLSAPLGLMPVRKIGVPGRPELAAGAIVDADPPLTLFNRDVLRASGLTEADLASETDRLRGEITARRALYPAGRAPVAVRGRTAVLVDDGIATGATIAVTIRALQRCGPTAIWVAVPVAPRDAITRLAHQADRVICLLTPEMFCSVGAHFHDFRQVSDEQVVRLLDSFAGDCIG